MREVAASYASGARFQSEYRMLAADDHIVWFSDQATVVRDGEGKPLFLQGVMFDITESKRAEEALRREKEFSERLINSSVDGILAFDRECRYMTWNPGMERISGVSRSETLGKFAFEVFPFLLDTGEDRFFKAALAGETLVARERPYVVPETGRQGHFEGHYTPLRGDSGEVIGGLAIIRDITERRQAEEELRQSEERFRLLFENSRDGIVCVDGEGQIQFANDAAASMLGYTSEEFLKLKITDIEARESEEEFEEHFADMLKGRRHSFETQHKRKDGTVADVDVTLNPLTLDGQHLTYSIWRDITERKQAEEKLRTSEEQFRQLLDRAGDAVFLQDLDGRFVNVNRQACESLGYSRSELLALRVWDVEVGWTRKDLRHLHQTLRGCPPATYQGTQRRKDGTTFPVEVRIGPFRWRSQDFMLVLARNITDRKRAEAALRRQRNEQEIILDSVPAAIFYKDRENRLVRVNKALAESAGMTKAEMEGKSLFDLYPGLAEDYWRDDREVMASGQPKTNIIEPLQTPEGTIWLNTDKIPYMDENGDIIGVIGFSLDITERKRAEEALRESEVRFRTIYENAPVLIDAFDENGRCVLWNNHCREIFGWTIDEINAHDDPLALFYPDPTVRDEVMRTVTTKPDGRFREWHPVTRDGKALITMWANFRLPDGLAFNLGYDITEHRRAEEALAKHRDHLEELVEERTRQLETSRAQLHRAERLASIGTLSAGIAHEINNPLGMIMLSTDAALKSIDKPEAVEKLLRQSRLDVERCARIVKGVLRFARDQSTEKWGLDLNDIVRHTLDFTQEYARKRGVTVETRLADTLHPVLANSTEMEQVGVNLVHNAANACSDGGRVAIETNEVDDKVRLIVRDNGCGLSKEQVKHVFDPFFTTRLEKGGTGLGLSTVHGIVTDHGGTIDVTSTEGKGTTFTLDFPRHTTPKAEHDENTGR